MTLLGTALKMVAHVNNDRSKNVDDQFPYLLGAFDIFVYTSWYFVYHHVSIMLYWVCDQVSIMLYLMCDNVSLIL